MKLASRFGAVNFVRRDRPLTRDELAHYVPSVFSEEKHESRSDRYTYIPTIPPSGVQKTRISSAVKTAPLCCWKRSKPNALQAAIKKSRVKKRNGGYQTSLT